MSVRRPFASVLLVPLALLLALLTPLARAEAAEAVKLVDPDTSSRWTEVFGEGEGAYSTENAGRIWVDKSVLGSSEEAAADGLPVTLSDERHGFVVELSALASAASVRQENGVAHDVVLVVSTNSTLASLTYGGRPQAAHLADALNDAIGRLMAEDDGTRVCVVGYDAQVTTLMPLGTYEPDEQGRYVSFSEDSQQLLVTARPRESGVTTEGATFRSGSYLQRAVKVAGDVLADAAADDPAREPVLFLMGTDVPLMANTNWQNPPVYDGNLGGFLGPLPGSHESGQGTDALLATMLTMRDARARVEKALGEKDALTVLTCGLDTNEVGSYVLETPHDQALTPLAGSGAAAGTDLRDNLRDAVEALAAAAGRGEDTVTLSLYGSGPQGLVHEDVTLATAGDLVTADDGAALGISDDFLPARSAAALSWALETVVDRTLGVVFTAPASGGPGADEPGGSRITVSDEVGAGMEVAQMGGIVYGDYLLDGSGTAQAVQTALVTYPGEIEAGHEVSYLVQALAARYGLTDNDVYGLLYAALTDGQLRYASDTDFSSRISWYVNADHGMVALNGLPYAFASQAEVDAVTNGDWQQSAVAEKVEAARQAGATALCETYLYVGNLEDPYSGGDVALYDFAVMVETDLATGRQTVLLSAPVEAVPALRTSVSLAADGSATMALDDTEAARPVRLAYEVAPRPAVRELLERAAAGEAVSDEELADATGGDVAHVGLGSRAIYASSFTGTGDEARADATASAWAADTNAYYSFVRDTPLFVLREGEHVDAGISPTADQLEPLTELPETGDVCYFEQTVYTARLDDPAGTAPATAEHVYVPYVVALDADGIARHLALVDGRCVALAGTPRYVTPFALGSRAKDPNATHSAPYVELLSIEEAAEGGVRLAASLGNNGALVLPPAEGVGTLAVEKDVEGGHGDEAFRFTVTLSDPSGTPLSGTASYEIDGEAGSATLDESGSFSVTLADGQRLVVGDVPQETRYVIREDDYTASGYLSLRTGSVGVVGADGAQATFTNVWAGGQLGVAFVMAGSGAEADRAVSVEVVVRGLFSAHPTSDELAFEATRHDGTDASPERMVFARVPGTDDGRAVIEGLTGGQGVLIDGLPAGAAYTASLLDAEALAGDGYETYAGSAEEVADGRTGSSCSGTIAGEDAVSAAYFVSVRAATEPDPDPDPKPEPKPDPDPDPEPKPDDTSGPDDGGGDGSLPQTSDPSAPPVVPLALGAVGAGLVILAVIRRRR